MMFNDENLKTELRKAIASVEHGGNEEEGGFILQKDGKYEFTKIKNSNTGTPTALCLYTADRTEFGEKIIPKTSSGWEIYASFHTHPGTSVTPSNTDITRLFRGQPNNFIYSPMSKDMNGYYYKVIEDTDYWITEKVNYNESSR